MSAARSRRLVAVRLLTALFSALLVLVGCGFSKSVGTDRPATPDGSVTTPSPTTGPDAFERGGRTDDIRLTLPARGTAEPYPLVIALHSLYHDGTEPQHEWGLDELARSAGFAVAYPDGIGLSWNAGTCCGPAAAAGSDDVDWLRSLIAHLESRHPIDPRRVSIIGLSNGGMLAYRYACEHGDELAGFAAVAASLQTFSCVPPAPLTTVSVHGGADGHVPYAGALWSEPLQTGITPVDVSLAPFRSVDGCPPPTQPGDTVLTGADGRPVGAAGGPVAGTDPAGIALGAPGITAPGVIAAAGTAALPAPVDPTPAAAGGAAPAQPATQAPVAVRHETVCSTSARVVQYVLPTLGHGWPPLVGDGAFATAQVLWSLLETGRSAVAGPRICAGHARGVRRPVGRMPAARPSGCSASRRHSPAPG